MRRGIDSTGFNFAAIVVELCGKLKTLERDETARRIYSCGCRAIPSLFRTIFKFIFLYLSKKKKM